jgi:Peptidase family C25./Propeptide_C25.
MKNFVVFLLSMLPFGAVFSQANVQVLSKSRSETLIRLQLGGIHQTAVQTPEGEAVTVQIKGGTPLLEEGAPDLPKIARSLLIPDKGGMAVEIVASKYQDYPDVLVAPSKGNLLRKVDPATVPYPYGPAYERNEFFPNSIAALQAPFVMRDVRGQTLWVSPVQYNPVARVLRVYTELTLRVFANGQNGQNERVTAAQRGTSATFGQLYQKLFDNYDRAFVNGARGGDSPEKMLVVAHDPLIPHLDTYIAWKRQMGIHTTVVPVSETGNTPAALYDFVKNYYDEHGISYLLLVGDENAITPMVRPGSIYSCDNCLGYMEGDDHFPEIFVGRFHASNPAQLRVMVNRNLNYETTPLADSLQNWCATGMASASNEGQGFGDDGQADYEHANEWKAKHLADGFENYWEFYDGTHGNISPTPGHITADKPGDPVNSQLVAVMNSPGVSIYNYTGHGWEQGLSSGNFNTNAVANLRNFQRYPIVIAVACCAGNFTNNGGGDCLGEAMQRAGDPVSGEAWGGIAGFYSSDFQSWSPPMEGQDGMNQYLVDADGVNLKPSIGGMATYGNALMIAAYGQGGIDMADVWNPFCDPTTVPRTAMPAILTAEHTPSTIIGNTSLTVDCPVEGALVSLYWKGQTLAVATVVSGSATLTFPALDDAGELTVTATQFNFQPYQGTISVVPANGAYVVSQAWSLDDSAGGNGDQRADFAETIVLNLSLSNLGDQLATATSVTLSTLDANVTILDGEEVFGDINANDTAERAAAFEFSVNDDVADGHAVPFTLEITFGNGQKYVSNFSVKLNAPQLEVGDLSISDAVGGDGDNRLESGETALVTIKNLNWGNSRSPAAIGQLVAGSPWLTVSGLYSIGPIDPLTGIADAVFEVTVATDAPQVVDASFSYVLVAGSYGALKNFGPYVINPIIETFETHNFSSFPWKMEGNKPWFTTATSAYTGTYSSRSGIITHNQQSVMSLTLEVTEAGKVSFARRVSSEQDYDFLRFLMDGQELESWSGLVPWGEVSYPVSTGVHTFAWVYQKDDFGSANQDRAWVDDVFLPVHKNLVSAHSPAEADFKAFISPNPTAGSVFLQAELPSSQSLDVRVLNGLGQEVMALPGQGIRAQGTFTAWLDISGLSSGVYYVRLQGETGMQALRLVKQ